MTKKYKKPDIFEEFCEMEQFDFLSEQNTCGQTLLRLVSRGNAIIAELLRLSANVPPCFFFESSPSKDQKGSGKEKKEKKSKKGDKGDKDSSSASSFMANSTVGLRQKSVIPESELKYRALLFDFQYLGMQEYFDNLIDSNPDLVDLDEEFRDAHIELLERFYSLFESVWKFINDFQKLVEDIQGGIFIQHTLEIILQNIDGKQLLCEALYLLGVILYLLDLKIEGEVRERLIVSYIRYKGSQEIETMEEVCNLCRNTGFSSSTGKRPPTYPVDYFGRFALDKEVIAMVVGRLRSDDIYGQIATYPLPDHRSVALADQAAMLFIILFFAPDILHNQQAVMREIVDKHFSDNWIISFYMGYTSDLSYAWENFRAAKMALDNTIDLQNVSQLQRKAMTQLPTLQKSLSHYLTEGVLTEQYVLHHINQLLTASRDYNVLVRWMLLHLTSKQRRLNEILFQGVDLDTVLIFLLDLSQFEYLLKNILSSLVEQKEETWDKDRKEGKERMSELSEFFSGEKVLTRVQKDEGLKKWFAEIAEEISSLDFQDSTLAGRKIQQLMNALEEVEQFHQIESNVHIKHFLADTRSYLVQMIRTVNIKEDILVKMSIISDMSYATQIINGYTALMQSRIKRSPGTVIKLRATFLKLASMLDQPLVRINQANSPDLISVSKYYSGELVAYVRHVLEIIPKSMFHHLNEIIALQTNQMKEIPTRIEKADLKTWAQLDSRAELAKATHSISVFTQGILAMETTLVGVIKVEPKQLLEDGIRKELVHRITTTLHRLIVFSNKGSGGGSGRSQSDGSKSAKGNKSSSSEKKSKSPLSFEDRLVSLATTLDGFRRSFEYISDYINIYGLRIWQEEFTRIIGYNVEQECNAFLKKKVYDWASAFQNETIPIPRFEPLDDQSVTFIGRLARQVLKQSSPYNSVVCEQMNSWVNPRTGQELVGIRTFSLLHTAVGTPGLAGLDRLLCFMIVKDIQTFNALYRREVNKEILGLLTGLQTELSPTTVVRSSTYKSYSSVLLRMTRIFPPFLDLCLRIGQKQLVRKQIANELNFSSKLDSNLLTNALTVLNRALLLDVHQHYAAPDTKPYPDESNPLLSHLASYLDTTGIASLLLKIYVTTDPLPCFAIFLFLFCISHVIRCEWNNRLGALIQTGKKETWDGVPLTAGIITLLKQFHSSNAAAFLGYIGQYVRATMNQSYQGVPKPSTLPNEIQTLVWFLEQYCRLSETPLSAVQTRVPPYMFESKTAQQL